VWRRLYVPAIALLALCPLLCLSACSKGGDTPEAASEATAEFAVTVKVAPIVRTGIKATIYSVGTVHASNNASISAKLPGKVEKILAEEGDRVKAGQTLLILEKTDLILTVRQATAALSMAEAGFAKAQLGWNRAQELLQQGIASQEQYDTARADYDIAEARVKQAKADLELARYHLDNTNVTNLFGGVVTRKFVDIGERVSPGQPLFEVAEIQPVEVEIGVSDRRFSELRVGQPVTISVDGYPDRKFTGEVTKIQPAIDPATRTFKVTVRVANPEELLKPGMFARAEIEIGYHPDALVMPKSAVLEEEGRYYAVAVRDGRVHRTDVTLGYRDGERIEVLGGLAEGEQVVLEGAYALGQGVPVRIAGE
jgi:RND family efflux transporter MFP subunit